MYLHNLKKNPTHFYVQKSDILVEKPAENHTVHWREFCGFHGCFVTVLLGVPLGASKVN